MVAIKETNEQIAQDIESQGIFFTNEATELLNKARVILKKRLSFFVFQGFFEPLIPLSLKDQVLIIEAPSSFHRNWVYDHYMPELTVAVKEAANDNIKVEIVDNNDPVKRELPIKKKIEEKRLKEKPAQEAKSESQLLNFADISLEKPEIAHPQNTNNKLNPSYSFESFVQGPSNQICFAAAQSVAEQPGKQYSPLFIFGGVGLGKTHLLHAIGHKINKLHPSLRVTYISAEQWVNSYIQAIRERKFDSFRSLYRQSCDVLLIDDIQFLAGKNASQDEFFHTFNCLHEAKKQIVLTSDKYPHEIDGLEDRLKTRLAWGLIADIRPPEKETRIAILQQKALNLGINLNSEVLNFLASSITSSVRELEGALMRLSACATITSQPIKLDQAKEYLAPMLRKKTVTLSWQKICEIIAQNYGLRVSDLTGKSRQQQVSFARQVSMMFCRSFLSMSSPEIGKAFGGRDHSTVLSALKKIEIQKQKDISLEKDLLRLREKIISLDLAQNS